MDAVVLPITGIVSDPKIRSGRPIIEGTTLRVMDVAALYKYQARTPEQIAEWKKSGEPLQKQWADSVRKAGGDPDAIMKELRTSLDQEKASF